MSQSRFAHLIAENARTKNPVLDLSKSSFFDIPSTVGELTHLVELRIDRSRLCRVDARVMSKLVNLTRFSARGCTLKVFPDGLAAAPSLEYVDCSDNMIYAVSGSIQKLARLNTLNLSKNSIRAVAQEIGDLGELLDLDLSWNELTHLPGRLSRLSEKVLLRVDGNPLASPERELAQRGTQQLFSYLARTLRGTPLWEAKCVVLGEGNVGKTSLLAAIQDEDFVEDRPTTHGIELTSFTLTKSPLDGDDTPTQLTVRAWDFGGQAIYRTTHQFFLSRSCVYIVAWRPREGAEENRVEHWIRTIINRVGTDVNILVVATHGDEGQSADIDTYRLREMYSPCIAGFLTIDSKSKAGIRELEDTLFDVAMQVPSTHFRWPAEWRSAREEILQLQVPQIDFVSFERICLESGVSRDDCTILATALNDSGMILFFPDDSSLDHQLVLSPEWLSQSISAVLENDDVRQNLAIANHRELGRIWSSVNNSPPSMHPYLLRIMERFDISYRMDDQVASLIAPVLPYERPELPEWQDDDQQLELICQLSDDADGLIPWLIVRHHRFSKGKHWRHGVYLYEPRDRSHVLIEFKARNLRLRVRGQYPSLMLDVMRDSIESLLMSRWPGITYTFVVPCPESSCAGTFKLRALVEFAKRNIRYLHCDECFENLDIGSLLKGYYDPTSADDRLQLIESKVESIQTGIDLIRAHGADLRTIKKMLSVEVDDCPRIFTLAPDATSKWNPSRMWESRFTLTLWCEEERAEHPVEPPYSFTRPREWFENAAPYIKLVSRLLSLAVPISAGATGITIGGLQGTATSEVMLMKGVVDAADTFEVPPSAHRVSTGISQSDGAALRFFRQFLFELDPSRMFAGLRRVTTPAGDKIYVCAHHYLGYDPGLPQMDPGPAKTP